jgi:prephenate dehydrogenase
LVSHLPQLTASALAALVGARASESALGLVGQGLRDTTRIASSPPALWGQILERNAAYVSPLLRELAERLTELAAGLEGPQAGQAAFELIAAGNTGVERLPGKHSAPQQAVDVVMVLLKDVPGALVAVLSVAHDAGVNVEDIRIEHVPGAAVGSAALVVVAGTGDDLAAALGRAGWSATVERPDPPR